jgi:hypothetical protein
MQASTGDPPDPPPRVWLRGNRRALAVGVVAALVLTAGGCGGAFVAAAAQGSVWWMIVSLALATIGGYFALSLAYQLTLPRLAYADGHLLVYLQSAKPTPVPIDIVELFFLGRGSSLIPQTDTGPNRALTVVVRLAEAATDWHDRPVKGALGEWREGYIILRGTWCEPLNPAVIQRLSRHLAAVQRTRRLAQEARG